MNIVTEEIAKLIIGKAELFLAGRVKHRLISNMFLLQVSRKVWEKPGEVHSEAPNRNVSMHPGGDRDTDDEDEEPTPASAKKRKEIKPSDEANQSEANDMESSEQSQGTEAVEPPDESMNDTVNGDDAHMSSQDE